MLKIPKQRLPLDCTADYYEHFLSKAAAGGLYQFLLSTYQLSKLRTRIETNGAVTWSDYGKIMFVDQHLHDSKVFPEEIWGHSQAWPTELWPVKQKVEAISGHTFSVGVCIFYPDGNAGVGFHADHIAFGDTTVIPSLSLGEERIFQLRENKTREVYEVKLAEGSLLIMGEHCQQRYEHSLPVDPKCRRGRINITFRKYGFA